MTMLTELPTELNMLLDMQAPYQLVSTVRQAIAVRNIAQETERVGLKGATFHVLVSCALYRSAIHCICHFPIPNPIPNPVPAPLNHYLVLAQVLTQRQSMCQSQF